MNLQWVRKTLFAGCIFTLFIVLAVCTLTTTGLVIFTRQMLG